MCINIVLGVEQKYMTGTLGNYFLTRQLSDVKNTHNLRHCPSSQKTLPEKKSSIKMLLFFSNISNDKENFFNQQLNLFAYPILKTEI
jgi:hypothetical protein